MNVSMPAFASAAIVTTAMALALPAYAQGSAWPTKPITIIVPYPAGGPTDQLARRLGDGLSKALGQPVLVENTGGAMGAIGMAKLVRAPADGHTIAVAANSTHAIAPHLAKLPYDPIADTQSLGGTVSFAYALIVNPAEPANTARELAVRSKNLRDGISYGSSGIGSGNHLMGEMLAAQAGGNFTHVAYKGMAPAQNDVLGGHLGFMFVVVGTAAPLVESGKLKALGVTSKTRNKAMPNVPVIAESVPGFEGLGWFAFFGPKGMPPEVTNRLSTEMNKIYRTPEFADFLEKNGYDAPLDSPADLARRVTADYDLWKKVISAAGIKQAN